MNIMTQINTSNTKDKRYSYDFLYFVTVKTNQNPKAKNIILFDSVL